jgi:hypothetical protein
MGLPQTIPLAIAHSQHPVECYLENQSIPTGRSTDDPSKNNLLKAKIVTQDRSSSSNPAQVGSRRMISLEFRFPVLKGHYCLRVKKRLRGEITRYEEKNGEWDS